MLTNEEFENVVDNQVKLLNDKYAHAYDYLMERDQAQDRNQDDINMYSLLTVYELINRTMWVYMDQKGQVHPEYIASKLTQANVYLEQVLAYFRDQIEPDEERKPINNIEGIKVAYGISCMVSNEKPIIDGMFDIIDKGQMTRQEAYQLLDMCEYAKSIVSDTTYSNYFTYDVQQQLERCIAELVEVVFDGK